MTVDGVVLQEDLPDKANLDQGEESVANGDGIPSSSIGYHRWRRIYSAPLASANATYSLTSRNA
jgi:hypothetical protein